MTIIFRRVATAVAISAVIWLGLGVAASRVWATGDTGWSCPAGTDHVIKIDNLSGPTFTIPTPPAGWTILAVSVKAGPDHTLFRPVAAGQVLEVKAATGYDVSHVHLCKQRIPDATTTTEPTTTTTAEPTTTTTTEPTTTTTVLTTDPPLPTYTTTTIPSIVIITAPPDTGQPEPCWFPATDTLVAEGDYELGDAPPGVDQGVTVWHLVPCYVPPSPPGLPSTTPATVPPSVVTTGSPMLPETGFSSTLAAMAGTGAVIILLGGAITAATRRRP